MIRNSEDWIFQEHIKKMIKTKHNTVDFYWEDGKMIMTEHYHAKRGSCCGNKCRHCVYEPKYEKGCTTLKKE
jgi:hypothetical protein